MTTRITVTTGDGGLVERNAQQQAANRQGAVVRNNANKATAAGTERRRVDRIATGRNPTTGDPLIPPSSATTLARLGAFSTPGIPRLRQEIGASRRSLECQAYILYCPSQQVLDEATTVPAYAGGTTYFIPVLCKPKGIGLKPKQPVVFEEVAYPASAGLSFATQPILNTPTEGTYGQTYISAPNTTQLQNRLEWTNLNGQFTSYSATTSFIPIANKEEPEFTLEVDLYITTPKDETVSLGFAVRLWSDITNTNTDLPPSLLQDNVSFDLDLNKFTSINFYETGVNINRFQPDGESYVDFDSPETPVIVAGWRRYCIMYKKGKFTSFLDGKKFRTINFPSAKVENKYEAITFIIDAETDSEMPAISAARFIQKALYPESGYTPQPLIASIPRL